MKNYITAAILFILIISACSPAAPYPAPPPSPIPTEPSLTLAPFWTLTPTFTLTPTQTDTCTPTLTPPSFITYTILPSDTCALVAIRFNITIDQILDANPSLLSDCKNILQATTLLIPASLIASTALPPAIDLPTLASTIQATLAPKLTLPPTSAPLPTSRPVATNPPAPTSPPAPVCCKHCSAGIPCGDSCIAAGKTCTKPPGCACKP